jgi:hypothetical protein
MEELELDGLLVHCQHCLYFISHPLADQYPRWLIGALKISVLTVFPSQVTSQGSPTLTEIKLHVQFHSI